MASPRRAALGLGLAAVVVLLGWNAVRRAEKGRSSRFDEHAAFSRGVVFEGEDVYATWPLEGSHSKYPLLFPLLFAPFAALPTGLGAWLWFLLNLAFAVAAIGVAARAARGPPDDPAATRRDALAVGVLLAWVVVTNLQTGQVNLAVALLVALGFAAAARGRDGACGLWLGLATALKVTPALLVAWLLWRGRLRAVLFAGLAVVLGWAVLPVLVLGPEAAFALTSSWVDVMLHFAGGGPMAEGSLGARATNQSLAAAVHRHLGDVPASVDGLRVHVLALAPSARDAIARGLALAVLAVLAVATRGRVKGRRDASTGFALAVVVMLLVAPITWLNHFAVLVVPFAVLVAEVRSAWPSPRARRRGAWLVAAALLIAIPGPVPRAWPLPAALSLPLLGVLVLGGLLLDVRRREDRSAP